ncbi:GlxA family transcriptional regulator [Actinoplanes sp. NPDC049668]|uniref:GlxA family transcriptional regulator n=1 Tax=unclassified Actinoplanes TaxID=2626549 RepID=UPI0033B23A8C
MERRTVVVIFDGFQLLDLAGPADVFSTANLLTRADGYRLEVAAVRAGQVRAQSGILTQAQTPLAGLTGPIDTLLVVGGLSLSPRPADRELVAEIARLAPHCRRITSVCNGAFLLAAAGLLDGRRATTHWLAADRLASCYPRVRVDADAIYVRDENVWTSAGVTAGIDLALALVAEDHGHELARQVARGLVVYLQRPGGQSQFSTPMRATTPPSERFRELQAFIDDNPAGDLSVSALARRSAMSERHFSRLFTAQTGMSPGRYVERSRAEAARRLLEVTADPLDRVARESGLGGSETLYRTFRRHWRISPGDYRRRFRTAQPVPTEES